MTFLEELKYELWEFGWDSLLGCLKMIIPFLFFCFSWRHWKDSYSERQNTYGERLEIQVNAQLKNITPRTFLWVGYTGPKVHVIGYELTYDFSFYGENYEGKDLLPRNSEFPVKQMIKQLADTTLHHSISIRVDKNNPQINQVVIQPLIYN